MTKHATKVIIVSNRLPVTVQETAGKLGAKRAIGGLATALDAVLRHWPTTWIGWSGFNRVLGDAELERVDLPSELVPVQATAGVVRRYYDHFANGALWPVLHGMDVIRQPSNQDWRSYQEMNRRFAEATQRAITTGNELIWVHDYHLFLVPRYLRQAGVTNPIGFFLHTPFPSYGVAQDVPYMRQLLAGISAADLVGLQTKRDVRNFRWTLRRMEAPWPGRVGAFPIGVNFDAYYSASRSPLVRQKVRGQRKIFGGRRVIFSLSRLDYTKGILAQLRAVERFLATWPRPGEVVYKLVVAPSREHLGEYRKLKDKIDRLTRRINKRFGTRRWQPVDYEYQNIGFEDVVASYKTADVLLLLPEIDGMNLVAKEYIAARKDDEGVLVISDTMGSAFQLSEALQVAADDTVGAAAALEHAASMSDQERADRWRGMTAAVRDEDVLWWANSFLGSLRSSAADTR